MLKMDFSKKTEKKTQKKETSVEKDESSKTTAKKKGKFKSSFKVGDTVVYPFHGIGKIEKTETHQVQGNDIDFFVINIPSNKMTIAVPIEMAEEKGIRHLISQAELDSALVHLKDKPDNSMDWKVRQQTNNSLVKKGDILSNIKVIVSLHSRNKEKELPLQERRIYDSSVTMLKTEMSIVMKITEEEAGEIIKSYLP